jgi:hypothetical protein
LLRLEGILSNNGIEAKSPCILWEPILNLMKMRWLACAFLICIASLAVSAKSRRNKAPIDPAKVEGSKEWWAEKKRIASEQVRHHHFCHRDALLTKDVLFGQTWDDDVSSWYTGWKARMGMGIVATSRPSVLGQQLRTRNARDPMARRHARFAHHGASPSARDAELVVPYGRYSKK